MANWGLLRGRPTFRRLPLSGCYHPSLASNNSCPRYISTSKPDQDKNDGLTGEEVKAKLGEEPRVKMGDNLRLKLSEERLHDLGRAEERPKLQTPRVSTRPLNFEEARDLAQKAIGQQKALWSQKIEDLRVIFGGQTDQPRTPEQEWYYKRVSFWMKRYENVVGLTEVKAAQARVVECERKFIETQEMRREAQKMISDVQKRIKDIHLELEKTHRGEDRYLVLVTQEHQVLKEEKNLLDEFKFYEKGEREYFSNLSNAVRDSHEKERAQAEKTKYWSILGSILGTCIGIIGTTINNRMRMAELRRLVSQNSSVEEIQAIGEGLAKDFKAHQEDLAKLVSEVQIVVEEAGGNLKHLSAMEEVMSGLKESSDRLNTRVLDTRVGELAGHQDVLAKTIAEHQDKLDKRMEDIQSDLFVQTKNVSQLSHITLKDREKEVVERENREEAFRKQLGTLVRQGETLESTMQSNTRDIQERMKDVRSLLLMEAQVPKFDTSRWNQKLEGVELRQAKMMQEGFESIDRKITQANKVRLDTLNAITNKLKDAGSASDLHLVEVDTIMTVMESQQRKTQQTVILSTLTIAVLAPAILLLAKHAGL